MMRRFGPGCVNMASKMVFATYLLLCLFIHYKLKDFQGPLKKNLTSAHESMQCFIPRCFRSVDDLINSTSDQRWRLEIKCKGFYTLELKRNVSQLTGPYHMRWKTDLECLQTFVKNYCYGIKGQTIPNIVHFVWFGSHVFKEENFVSVLSAVRYQQPCAILFHAEELPYGPYWSLLLSIVPELIHVIRKEPTHVFGLKLGPPQHSADVARLEILHSIGGIYLDSDQLLVRSVAKLLTETVVMSHESKNNLANSMILAKPGAEFIDLWFAQYQWYNAKKWGYHSTFLPWRLAQKYPSLIKVVGNRFVNPDLTYISQVFTEHYDVRTNYGLHLYTRFYPDLHLTLPLVTTWNSTLGEVWRKILYSTADMFNCSTSVIGSQSDT